MHRSALVVVEHECGLWRVQGPGPGPGVHGAGSQVGVFVLELPVQRQAPLLSVAVQQRRQGVDVAGVGAGRHLVAAARGATAKRKLSVTNSSLMGPL